MKRYAVLFAPEFRLQATLRHAPHLDGQSVALLDSEGKKPRVAEFNALARSTRVEAGMTPTQAMARCAELVLVSGNAGHERSGRTPSFKRRKLYRLFWRVQGPASSPSNWPLNVSLQNRISSSNAFVR